MRKIAVSVACALSAFLLASPAAGDVRFGVADDTGKNAPDGGATFYGALARAGLSEDAITVRWEPNAPFAVSEYVMLDRTVAQASAHGIRLVFVVTPSSAAAISSSPQMTGAFGTFLRLLAARYPRVRDYEIGLEPNQPRFWQPQFNPDGSPASGAAYEAFLAAGYDALKTADPTLRVIGFNISDRGNDNPFAASNVSTSPVRFIHDAAAAFRASGRSRPLMDAFGYHPYPLSSSDPLSTGARWPNAGVPNLDRIDQAIWDGFAGTAQPTLEQGLQLAVTEIGWQTAIPAGSSSAYTGEENVPVTDEATQARIYGEVVHTLECNASVSDVLFFHFVDEIPLEGFQTGLLRADWTTRPAYNAVVQALDGTRGGCLGTVVHLKHTTGVVGAALALGKRGRSWRATARAEEDVDYTAGVVRVGSSRIDRRSVVRALAQGSPPEVPFGVDGELHAYWNQVFRFPVGALPPGRYVLAVRLSASLAPQRTALFVKPFRVLRGRSRG